MPMTLVLVVVAAVVALACTALGARGLSCVALAANLWLAGWWVVALTRRWRRSCCHSGPCVRGDRRRVPRRPRPRPGGGRAVALRAVPGRTLLRPLEPALHDAPRPGVRSARRCFGRLGVAVAAVALVLVGGNRFGADGGGLLVLLAGYGVLVLRLQRASASRPYALAVLGWQAVVVVGAGARRSRRGARRIEPRHERPRRRTWSPSCRRPRRPARALRRGASRAAGRRDRGQSRRTGRSRRSSRPVGRAPPSPTRFWLRCAVSLIVNDTPADVARGRSRGCLRRAAAGRSHPRPRRPVDLDRLRAMRRSTIACAALLAALAFAVAGCSAARRSARRPRR